MTFSWARLGTWAVALAVGAVYGVAGTVAQAYTLASLPVGLVLSVVGVAALLTAVRLLTADRWAALSAGLGAIAVAIVFSGAGPGGSVIVPGGALGVTWMILLPITAAVVVAWPDLSRNARGGPAAGAN